MTKNEYIASLLLEAADLLKEDNKKNECTIKSFIINSRKSVGPIKFSDTQDKIRKVLGQNPNSFKDDKHNVDDYGSFNIYYQNRYPKSIEFYKNSDISLKLNGKNLLTMSMEETLDFIKNIDHLYKTNSTDIISPKFGLYINSKSVVISSNKIIY